MTTVPTQDYVWQQGEDLLVSLMYREGPLGDEVPVNLTGFTVRMDIVDNGGIVYTFNSADLPDANVDQAGPGDNEVVLGTNGAINIYIPRSLTLPGGPVYNRTRKADVEFNYDIFLRNPSNKQWPILRGTIKVERSYTLWP